MTTQHPIRDAAWEVVGDTVKEHPWTRGPGASRDTPQCGCGWNGEGDDTYIAHVADAVVLDLTEAGFKIVPFH